MFNSQAPNLGAADPLTDNGERTDHRAAKTISQNKDLSKNSAKLPSIDENGGGPGERLKKLQPKRKTLTDIYETNPICLLGELTTIPSTLGAKPPVPDGVSGLRV